MEALSNNKVLFSFILSMFWRSTSAWELIPVVKTSEQPLLCGDPPVVLGKVKNEVVGENLDVGIFLSASLEDKCEIIESHICNMPAPIKADADAVAYSIPIETVYDFVCLYESDLFVVAGHVTVECQEDILSGGSGDRRLEEIEGKRYIYSAFYEIPISCEEDGVGDMITTPEKFLRAVVGAEIVSLNHKWSEASPINQFNPGYDLEMVDTHAATVGLIPGLSFATDAIEFSGQHGGPTIDALGHMGALGTLFGGIPASTVETPNGLLDLGIDTYPESKYLNRGVLIDVARCKGVDRLDINYEITGADLEDCAAQQHVEIKPGDSVLIRVGFGPLFELDPATYLGNNGPYPAPSEDAANYLASKKIFLAGTDNLSFELLGTIFPAHRILIAENGIYIAENFWLEDLSAKCAELNTWEFSLVLNPLKIFGATGMALNSFALFAGGH